MVQVSPLATTQGTIRLVKKMRNKSRGTALSKLNLLYQPGYRCSEQCCGYGSVESHSPGSGIRIRFKNFLDPESGSVSNYTESVPTKTIENRKFIFNPI